MHYRGVHGAAHLASRGGATLAIRLVEPTKAIVSIARCSSEDVFNKKIGRTIALGRLAAHSSGKRNVEDFIRHVDITEGESIKVAIDLTVGEEMAKLGLY